ncbi:DUF87 domain-containing protein [Actinospica durhamensis]|uniref:DUF87 domain-containing protein n=1 Tax=Actinospica durhamensis TaxID=1508375 RepID=A0A941IT87_9ACTN|nr:DUF87 domain-containing protein [Actinospica durhamensis]MBR7839429.1 DUF87 domain-containing protein [Actinospica durhamensis]
MTLAVTGYPAEVLPGWLEALSAYPARLDVALHAEPVPPQVAADKLRRRRTRLEAGRREGAGRGQIEDPQVESAAQDAAELAGRIARSETKLFTAGLYLTCYADTPEDLAQLIDDVKALLSASLATAQAPTFRMLEAWQTTLPGAPDRIGQVRILDTAALAACVPLTSPDTGESGAVAPSAVLAGLSAVTGAPVFRDRWAQANHNSLILGVSGAGKSYLAKTDLIRELCTGTIGAVIDPEGEYVALAGAVGGRVIELGLPCGALNVLELPHPDASGPCELASRVLDLHSLCAVLLGAERAERLRPALDRAAMGAYRAAGISEDTASWTRPVPDLAAVARQAAAGFDPAATELAGLLEPYATGSYAALFNGAQPEGVQEPPLTVYTLRHLPDALRPAGMLLVLSRIWNGARHGERRRMLLIDEVWQLLQDEAAARFVLRFAKSARKYRLGLSLATQDVGDLLGSELGTAVACNAAIQILLGQAPQALARVTDAFDLTAGERDFLATAPRGYALQRTRTGRTALAVIATPDEEPFLHTGI